MLVMFAVYAVANTAPRVKVVDCRTMFPVISVIAFSPTQQQDLTVFHVNPAHYPAAPLNMDTGDALGDLYFDLRSVVTPIECAHPSPETGRDCDNQEVVANDLVITKLVLSVIEKVTFRKKLQYLLKKCIKIEHFDEQLITR